MNNLFNPQHKYPFIIGNIRVPIFFTFSQNPNSIRLEMDKEFNQTQTLGGYTFEHWGKKPTMMSGEVLIRKFDDLGGFMGAYRENEKYDLQDPILIPEYITFRTLFDIDQKRLNTYISPQKEESKNTSATKDALTSKDTQDKALQFLSKVGNTITGAWSSATQYLAEKNIVTSDTIIYYKDTIYSGFFTKLTTTDAGNDPFVLKINFTFLVTNTTNDWLVDSIFSPTGDVLGGHLSKVMSAAWGGATTVNTAGKLFKSFL